LNSKIKAGPLPALPLEENPLADWSAHLFLAARTQYVLLSNTKSLYSTVMYAKGMTNNRHFVGRALGGIREFLQAEGQEFVYRSVQGRIPHEQPSAPGTLPREPRAIFFERHVPKQRRWGISGCRRLSFFRHASPGPRRAVFHGGVFQ
jgi:hypothetical protein